MKKNRFFSKIGFFYRYFLANAYFLINFDTAVSFLMAGLFPGLLIGVLNLMRWIAG
ncbi:hypothetical protein [Microbulbifer aggregans]|uniref:hypothetical protein n=1 Tax=Microbulbifer aggregans TaxID=1769779 RepID=UPI001CFC528F|nr:hypothetical protein [Microbulbifer aggregans]